MFETIVVPLDGSGLAEAALTVATAIQEKFGSRLILVRALESESHRLAQAPSLFESPAAAAANVQLIEQMLKNEREEARAYLSAVEERLGATVGAGGMILEGGAAEAIVEATRETDASLIVMSSHGRGGIGRLVHGSVADAVLRSSPVPVLLVRNPPAEDS